MIEEIESINERLERLIAGTDTQEDREAIADYIQSTEERMECVLELIICSRDRYLKKAAALGDLEAQEWLKDRDIDDEAFAAFEAELRERHEEEGEAE